MTKSRLAALGALAIMALGSAAPVQAQVLDHRWAPDNAGFSSGLPAVPGVAPGAAGTSTTTSSACGAACEPPKPPEPPQASGTWKYAYDGRLWLRGTAGFAVWGASLGCYDNSSGGAGAASICGAKPNAVDSCIANGYGAGNCTSGVPFTGPYSQQTYVADTSYFFDGR